MKPSNATPLKPETDQEVIDCGRLIDSLVARTFNALHRFVISGKTYLAVPQEDWASAKAELGLERSLNKHVAGRLTIEGVRHVVLSARAQKSDPVGPASIAETLTRRELQVALYVAEGKCDKEIARNLGISSYTVREHMRRIFHKLNVSKRTAVVARVLGQAGETPH